MEDAIHTATAILTPFKPKARGAGLLSGSSTQSYKASAIIKQDIAIPAGCNNLSVMVNPSPWNDFAQVWYNNNDDQGLDNGSTINFSSTGLLRNPVATRHVQSASSAAIQTVGLPCSALPFSSGSAFGNVPNNGNVYDWSPPNVRARIVSAGLKLTFTGSTLADSGVGYALTDPQHENLYASSVSTYLSQMTSTKAKKLASRQELELHLAPVTDKMMQFGEPYEDILVADNTGCFVDASGSGAIMTTTWGVDGGSDNAIYIVPCDPTKNGRALSTLMYPLSRRNQKIDLSVSSQSFIIQSVSSAGVITWSGGNSPSQVASGHLITAGALSTTTTTQNYCIHYIGSNWYLCYTSGQPVNGTSAATAGVTFPYTCNIVSMVVQPAVLGAIILKGIQPLSTVHIEYVVHCEYIGIGVQGRQTPIIPNPSLQHVLMQALDDARESNGQDNQGADHKHLHHHAVESVIKIAGKQAPQFAEAVAKSICPEAAPLISTLMGNAGLASGVSNILGKRFRF